MRRDSGSIWGEKRKSLLVAISGWDATKQASEGKSGKKKREGREERVGSEGRGKVER